jgi:hypothetical protein
MPLDVVQGQRHANEDRLSSGEKAWMNSGPVELHPS